MRAAGIGMKRGWSEWSTSLLSAVHLVLACICQCMKQVGWKGSHAGIYKHVHVLSAIVAEMIDHYGFFPVHALPWMRFLTGRAGYHLQIQAGRVR